MKRAAWLRSGEIIRSTSRHAAAATLKLWRMDVLTTTKRGDTMSTNPNFATYERAQRTNDVMIVSSFALWAMLIGFVPVAALRLLGA
jgi:hypothetical protein